IKRGEKERKSKKEFVISQGEYAMLKKEDFDKLYIPGVESEGHTFLVIKALDNFDDKRSVSYLLAGHLNHYELQIDKANEEDNEKAVSIEQELKSNITTIVKDFIKISKTKNLHIVSYYHENKDGEASSTLHFDITEHIGLLVEKKLIGKNGLEKLSIKKIEQQKKGSVLNFMIKSSGSIGRQMRNSDIKKSSTNKTSAFTKTIERTWIEKRADFLTSISGMLSEKEKKTFLKN
ncbi:hypothetical protein ACFL0U_04015, partial [Pseudomonadota bacterium]